MPFLSQRASGWSRLWSLGLLCLLALTRDAAAQLNNDTSPTYQFKSRPDCHAPILNFKVNRPDLVSPGYIIFGLYRNLDPGPYIYDNDGNLVWSGACSSGPKTAHSPRPCEYMGSTHLCYFQGEQHQGFARGHGVIMNQNYTIVKIVESSGAGASSDMHEFKMTPYTNGTTMLMTVYQPRQYDLTTNPKFNIQGGMGWVVEGVFQEVEIATGRVVFEWRSLDHVDPGLSWTMPGTTDTSGDGLHEQTPWDYFHINSIDKNADGDYLISARHVGAIYKLSGKDGSIMWEMGGDNPIFEQTNFKFSYQHHARWISENATHTLLSFYDNAGNSYNATGEFSHGWVISIDHIANTATMIAEFGAPSMEGEEGGILSTSQGNMQVLADGHVHIGWGEHARFSEHLHDGTVIQYVEVADRASNAMIYRSHKYNWTATPLTNPDLWTYSKHGDDRSGMYMWASWNGATEVRSWNFYASNSSNGPWEYAGNVTKHGFETKGFAATFRGWAYAEAVDANGTALKRSNVQKTFVPSKTLVQFCHDEGCSYSTPVEEQDVTPYEADVYVDEKYLSTNRGFNTSHYYAEIVKPLASHIKSGVDKGVIMVPGVLLVVLVVGMFFAWLWQRGQPASFADKMHQQAIGLSDGVSRSAFGSKLLGKYTRILEKETDGFESGSSSSSHA